MLLECVGSVKKLWGGEVRGVREEHKNIKENDVFLQAEILNRIFCGFL